MGGPTLGEVSDSRPPDKNKQISLAVHWATLAVGCVHPHCNPLTLRVIHHPPGSHWCWAVSTLSAILRISYDRHMKICVQFIAPKWIDQCTEAATARMCMSVTVLVTGVVGFILFVIFISILTSKVRGGSLRYLSAHLNRETYAHAHTYT